MTSLIAEMGDKEYSEHMRTKLLNGWTDDNDYKNQLIKYYKCMIAYHKQAQESYEDELDLLT